MQYQLSYLSSIDAVSVTPTTSIETVCAIEEFFQSPVSEVFNLWMVVVFKAPFSLIVCKSFVLESNDKIYGLNIELPYSITSWGQKLIETMIANWPVS